MTTTEQYRAACNLLDLLSFLKVNTPSDTWAALMLDYGTLAPCDHCDEAPDECSCDADPHARYYANVDEDAWKSFD